MGVALLERERELAGVDALLAGGGVLVVEGGAGIGKTSLLEVACRRAGELGHEVLRARGSDLEAGFAFGVVRQLFERRLARSGPAECRELMGGPASAVRALFPGAPADAGAHDTSFAVLHGLYWLAANLAARRSVLIAVDDAHWADAPSLRWLAYLAARLDGLALALLVTVRPAEPASGQAALLAVTAEAAAVARPGLLSQAAVTSVVRDALDGRPARNSAPHSSRPAEVTPSICGNCCERPSPAPDPGRLDPADVTARGGRGVMRQVTQRIRRLDQSALGLAQALAVLGDGCELRHAAAIALLSMDTAARVAAGLVRLEVLAACDPPVFLHPVVRDAVESSLASDEREAAHRAAAGLLHADGAPPGQVAAHLIRVQPAGDSWVLRRLREAAAAATEAGAPQAAAGLLRRALAEPPPATQRVTVLRELARAEASAGRTSACGWLEEALAAAASPQERARISMEIAESYASLFRWVDAVDVIERALGELGGTDPALASRLEGELVVAAMHDARRASHVAPTLDRLAARHPAGAPAEALAVARGMAALLAGRPADEVADPLEEALLSGASPAGNWDTRAALLWSMVTAERFETVDHALAPMVAQVQQSGSARGLVATYSTLGLLRLRLGALPEADTAARIALRVLQEGDFAPGLAFAATVLADVAVEAGELPQARALLGLLPQADWPPGVGTVLIPAARGRLELAAGRFAEALADFRTCAAMFSAEVWGMELRDVGYLHARSGAAQALLSMGEREGALALAEAELADVRVFGGHRALGIALRVAGLSRGGQSGLDLLDESAAVLRDSPAILEQAKSLTELGAAQRRAGQRTAAREALAEGLDLAARCGARPLAARIRAELTAAGARPRREWRRGVEALTPSELRVARLAAEGKTNRQIAQGLYVTLKTVEGHLARAYPKLGITGRGELRGALDGENTRVVTR